jgi:tetratricopeptide (TPR) repeat protein
MLRSESGRARWTALAAAALFFVVTCAAGELPDDPAARAIALYDLERYDDAKALLEKLDGEGKATGPLLYRLAYCQRVAGDRSGEQETLARAVEVLQQEVLWSPTLEPSFYLANTYRNTGRSAEMKAVAAAATARVESGETEIGDDPLECFRAGKLYADQSKYDPAVEWYTRALDGFEASLSSHPAYVKWIHRYLGDVAFSRGKFDQAAKHYGDLVADGDPGDWDRLAVAHARQGSWSEAVEAWKSAERANPADANRARYAWRLATAAGKIGALPDKAPSGAAWSTLDKAGLEAVMSEQSTRAKEIRAKAATEPNAEARIALESEIAAVRPVFVAACLEYTLRHMPIREKRNPEAEPGQIRSTRSPSIGILKRSPSSARTMQRKMRTRAPSALR